MLRARANFSASWAGRRWGFGADGQYFHARILPHLERPGQGERGTGSGASGIAGPGAADAGTVEAGRRG